MTEETFSWVRTGLIAAVVALMLVAGYAMYEHGQANRLAVQNQQVASTLQSTQTELANLKSMVTDLSAQQAQAQAQAQAKQEALRTAAAHRQVAAARRPRMRRDDPRWKQFQDKLDAQGQAIQSTRQDLDSAKTELSGSIARTHDELVLLEKKGERSYFEFNLSKSKQFQEAGPVGIKLRKANTKHQYADLELMVDDADLQTKHVNLYEPAVFYAADSGVPVELVINGISKNHIHGYVSEPRYQRSELSAMANSGGANGAAAAPGNAPNNSVPHPRQRLTLPQD